MDRFFLLIAMFLMAIGCGPKPDNPSRKITREVSNREVRYIDQRWPGRVIYYFDLGMKGIVSEVAVNDETGSEILRYIIEDREEVAEKRNLTQIETGIFGGLIHYWRHSPEARALNRQYGGILAEYKEWNPRASEFPENRPPQPLLNDKKLENRFRGLLAECGTKYEKMLGIAGTNGGIRDEVVQTHLDICSDELFKLWRTMPEHQQELVALTSRREFDKAGVILDTRNPIRSVNEWGKEFQEVDYRSTWSIVKDGSIKSVISRYRHNLARRGLIMPDQPATK